MMDDDIDIYGDLVSFEEHSNENYRAENQRLAEKCTEMEKKISEMTEGFEKIKQEKSILEVNLSALLKTAKNEISRKDRMIVELRQEIENATFRRGHFKIPKKNGQNNDLQRAKPKRRHSEDDQVRSEKHPDKIKGGKDLQVDSSEKKIEIGATKIPATQNGVKPLERQPTIVRPKMTVTHQDELKSISEDGEEEYGDDEFEPIYEPDKVTTTVFGKRLQKRLQQQMLDEAATDKARKKQEILPEIKIEVEPVKKEEVGIEINAEVVKNEEDVGSTNEEGDKKNPYRLIPLDLKKEERREIVKSEDKNSVSSGKNVNSKRPRRDSHDSHDEKRRKIVDENYNKKEKNHHPQEGVESRANLDDRKVLGNDVEYSCSSKVNNVDVPSRRMRSSQTKESTDVDRTKRCWREKNSSRNLSRNRCRRDSNGFHSEKIRSRSRSKSLNREREEPKHYRRGRREEKRSNEREREKSYERAIVRENRNSEERETDRSKENEKNKFERKKAELTEKYEAESKIKMEKHLRKNDKRTSREKAEKESEGRRKDRFEERGRNHYKEKEKDKCGEREKNRYQRSEKNQYVERKEDICKDNEKEKLDEKKKDKSEERVKDECDERGKIEENSRSTKHGKETLKERSEDRFKEKQNEKSKEREKEEDREKKMTRSRARERNLQREESKCEDLREKLKSRRRNDEPDIGIHERKDRSSRYPSRRNQNDDNMMKDEGSISSKETTLRDKNKNVNEDADVVKLHPVVLKIDDVLSADVVDDVTDILNSLEEGEIIDTPPGSPIKKRCSSKNTSLNDSIREEKIENIERFIQNSLNDMEKPDGLIHHVDREEINEQVIEKTPENSKADKLKMDGISIGLVSPDPRVDNIPTDTELQNKIVENEVLATRSGFLENSTSLRKGLHLFETNDIGDSKKDVLQCDITDNDAEDIRENTEELEDEKHTSIWSPEISLDTRPFDSFETDRCSKELEVETVAGKTANFPLTNNEEIEKTDFPEPSGSTNTDDLPDMPSTNPEEPQIHITPVIILKNPNSIKKREVPPAEALPKKESKDRGNAVSVEKTVVVVRRRRGPIRLSDSSTSMTVVHSAQTATTCQVNSPKKLTANKKKMETEQKPD